VDTVVVITDDLPERNKRRAMEKGVKMALKPLVPPGKYYCPEMRPPQLSLRKSPLGSCHWGGTFLRQSLHRSSRLSNQP
jgi:hypothetical protein